MTALPPKFAALYPWAAHQLPPSPFQGFWGFNPSVHRDSRGVWRCSVRNANYNARDGLYQVRRGQVTTRNTVLHLDPDDLGVVGEPVEVLEADGLPRFAACEYGYEDLRLYEVAGRLCAVATTAQLREEAAQEVVALTLDDRYRVVGAEPMRGEWSRIAQKNWSPFDGADSHRFLYSVDKNLVVTPTGGYDPQVLPQARVLPQATAPLQAPIRRHGGVETQVRLAPVEATRNEGRHHSVLEAPNHRRTPREPDTSWMHDGLRGGSQLVKVGEYWLGVGHVMDTRHHRATGQKLYYHRFYTTDGKRGPWFTFGVAGIEFCAGMVVDGDRVVLSFGADDAEAWLGVTELAPILNSLGDVR